MPAHQGVILRYGVESFMALGLLIFIKVVAERDLLPEGEVFEIALAGLLGFLLGESIARVVMALRLYRRDEAAVAIHA